jgi:hypothetical protein
MIEQRLRLFLISELRQTAHSQAMVGTPVDVPDPSTVTHNCGVDLSAMLSPFLVKILI